MLNKELKKDGYEIGGIAVHALPEEEKNPKPNLKIIK